MPHVDARCRSNHIIFSTSVTIDGHVETAGHSGVDRLNDEGACPLCGAHTLDELTKNVLGALGQVLGRPPVLLRRAEESAEEGPYGAPPYSLRTTHADGQLC